MKKEINSILLFIALCVFSYLICAFFAATLDLTKMPEGTRFFGAFMFICSAIIAAICYNPPS